MVDKVDEQTEAREHKNKSSDEGERGGLDGDPLMRGDVSL
jgi:hypothetical protein